MRPSTDLVRNALLYNAARLTEWKTRPEWIKNVVGMSMTANGLHVAVREPLAWLPTHLVDAQGTRFDVEQTVVVTHDFIER